MGKTEASHGLQFQAFHQHLYGLEPMVWFQHFRGRGTPHALAEACAAILSVTSTPLPQAPPSNPKTRLDVGRLSKIIGEKGTVGADGVVSFELPPTKAIHLGGVKINPYLNVYTSVGFQPLDHRTVVVPDFAQNRFRNRPAGTAHEIPRLGNRLPLQPRNRRTATVVPSHHYEVADAHTLAAEVRRGLNITIANPS